MANENKVFELMTQMYSEFSKKFEEIGEEFKELKGEVKAIHKTVVKIENDHGEKLKALFDGWKQNSDQLARIEKEVSRQDEIILRKIK